MAFGKSPCMLGEGWRGRLYMWHCRANRAKTSVLTGMLQKKRAELSCLLSDLAAVWTGSASSFFLLRPERAEPQGWKVKRGHEEKKFLLNLDFSVSYWLSLRMFFVLNAISFHPAARRILFIEFSGRFHHPLSFLFHQKMKQMIITTTSPTAPKLSRPSPEINK